MVFPCQSLSFLPETKTETKSTTTSLTDDSDSNRLPVTKRSKKPSNLRVFTVAELTDATANFCTSWKIGEGGNASVYKGVIRCWEHPFNQFLVAVKVPKQLSLCHEEWETEINIRGAIKHPNIVGLIGYCAEDTKRFLVYEYMVHGSLQDHLYDESEILLSWTMRLKVAQDVARSLTFLHEEMPFPVILRDFKPSKILLDYHWHAQLSDFEIHRLSDFGLAESRPRVEHTSVVGTLGYLAPEDESESTERCITKSDVWNMGVTLYILITGRRPFSESQLQNELKLLALSKPYAEGIMDPRLEGNYPLESALKLCIIANKCMSEDPKSRPKMSEVLEMVNQLIKVSSQATGPDKKTLKDNKEDSNGIQLRLPSCLSCV